MEYCPGITLEFGRVGLPTDDRRGPSSKLYKFRVRCFGQAAIGFPAHAIPANGSRVSGPVSTRLNFVVRRIHEAAD